MPALLALLVVSVSGAAAQSTPFRVERIGPAAGEGTNPSPPVVLGNRLYFTAEDPSHGRELWSTNKTLSDGKLVADVVPGPDSSDMSELTAVGNELFFLAANGTQLWKSNGTAAGTLLVKQLPGASTARGLTASGGIVLFSHDDGVHGRELWRSDGTPAGTVMLKDVMPGAGSSFFGRVVDVSGRVYFSADDGVHGQELWKSDGTPAGTVMVKAINAGGASHPTQLTDLDGIVLFSADDGIHGRELWKSDGTTTGTSLVKDINSGQPTSDPDSLTDLNGTLYFSAVDGTHGRELWKSDGTAAGTVMVADIRTGFGQHSLPSGSTAILAADEVVFLLAPAPSGPANQYTLWKSDGTAGGTVHVHDIETNQFARRDLVGVFAGGKLYFRANGCDGGSIFTCSPNFGPEPWVSDGTAAGTMKLADIHPSGGSWPQSFIQAGSHVFFTADDGTHGRELWAVGLASSPAALGEVVQALGLPAGTEASLLATLDNAQQSLDGGNTQAAIGQLEAFINQVEAQRGNTISEADADLLIAIAQSLIDGLS